MKKLILATLLLLAVFTTASAQLPKVVLKSIDGKTVSTDTLRNDGKPFIIDFFATWCKPCNRELTAISEVYEDWQKETGVKIIAVSIDQAQNINKVKPLVIVCDGEGNIVAKHNGYTEGAEEELIEKVRELINK